jgi:hypothetical protein
MERVINADSKKKGKAEVGHKEHAPPMNVAELPKLVFCTIFGSAVRSLQSNRAPSAEQLTALALANKSKARLARTLAY